MTERAERLRASHFDEAMGFLNEVFAVHGPHDFARLLPGIYQPDDEHMGHNLALRRDGRLVAVVGVFPIELRAGGASVRVAGVGGVSVARDQQGQGLFGRLMQLALEEIQNGGYVASFLNGMRQRYRRFGWEVMGSTFHYAVEPRNLRHAFRGEGPPELELEALPEKAGAALVRELQALHEAQPLHVRRSAERFPRLLRGWQHEPLLARGGDGAVLGYVSGNRETRHVHELVAVSAKASLDVLRALSARWGGTLELALPALPSPLTEALAAIAERHDVRASGNWLIEDFATLAGALLSARHTARPLPEGRVVVQSSGSGEAHALWVEGDRAGCEPTQAKPDLEAPRDELLRIVFGPLPPALVRAIPASAALLAAWCPLPLALSAQDHV